MTPEQYAAFPDELIVREVRVDHQVLVTTLLDHRKVSKYALSELYAQRWNVELDLRNLKTTTGMDVLNCQTPQMNERQLWPRPILCAACLIGLTDAADEREAVVGPSAGLQRDSTAHGSDRP